MGHAILILSSHVCTATVGGALQAALLSELRIRAFLVPTVLFGRHPGLGPPGGGATPDDHFAGMIEGVRASGALRSVEAVIAGYFASPQQVRLAGRAIDEVKIANPSARIVIDPIMGDEPRGLYIAEEVAEAIAEALPPRADLLCPNLWELRRLADDGAALAPLALAQSFARPVLVSSVEAGEEIGVIYADGREAWLAAHPRLAEAPRGAGDRLTALFTAALIQRRSPGEALAFAVGGVAASLGLAGAPRLERLA